MAWEARDCFDRNQLEGYEEGTWETVTVDRDTLAKEAPDVLIPLLVACEVAGVDLLARAEEKAAGDVARGVR